MFENFSVERRQLKKHAVLLNDLREQWSTTIPASLGELYTDGDEFTIAGDDFVSSLESVRARYSNDIVPGIASLMAEVVSGLQWVAKNYGDAEAASTVSQGGESLPTHQVQVPGDNPGDILGGSVRN
ncbi:hypothetical protein NE236_15020 [Actinoallomurus purpureus]|uniref:hypothetical protein n=1 Tax=Actinoallomurus purpureus TaxID=478114 RepID=UPI0020929855|nr:hypothetical protein [Actinoallomurus purpureus]MCO6006301.1 hypothetical protein [Actinoallomurus purpureus]